MTLTGPHDDLLKAVRSATSGGFLENFICQHIIELFEELSPDTQRELAERLFADLVEREEP